MEEKAPKPQWLIDLEAKRAEKASKLQEKNNDETTTTAPEKTDGVSAPTILHRSGKVVQPANSEKSAKTVPTLKLTDLIDYGFSNTTVGVPLGFDWSILEQKEIKYEKQGHTYHGRVVQVEQKANEIKGMMDVRLLLKFKSGTVLWLDIDHTFKLLKY